MLNIIRDFGAKQRDEDQSWIEKKKSPAYEKNILNASFPALSIMKIISVSTNNVVIPAIIDLARIT